MTSKKPKKETYSKDSIQSWLEHIALSITYGLLFMFLIANILYSQVMPEKYFSLIKGEEGVVIDVLQRAKELPYFGNLFPEVKEMLIENETIIFADTHMRRTQIDKLKETLVLNPESRDILFSLYLLYKQDGQEEMADEYLQRARAIDPTVGMETKL